MADDWQVGDLALCVCDTPHPRLGNGGLHKGAIYTVTRVCLGVWYNPVMGNGFGLAFAELNDNLPGGYSARRFRKIRPHTPDAEDLRTIALLNGKPVREDA